MGGKTNINAVIPYSLSIFQRNAHRYPVWAALARDHLAIMASSVSAERAFSSAGITITKRRNRLKGDIVEALQILKCHFKTTYMRSNSDPSLVMEEALEELEKEEENMEDSELCEEADVDWLDSDSDCYESTSEI